MADSKDLQKAQTQALAMPSFIEQGVTTGTEDIGADDLRLPRLSIAQGLSKQIIPGDASFIQGLGMFDLFNDLTGQIYGKGPVKFIVCRRDVRRIEFDPEDRGVPLDLDVPANDPRCSWTKDEHGKGVPPRATKFVEFVILLLDEAGTNVEPIVLSIKETNKFNRLAIERLTGFIKLRRPPVPIYAGLYSLKVGSEKNDKGTFGTFVVANEGYVQDPDMYAYAKAFAASLEGKTIHVSRDADDSGTEGADASFDPSTMGKMGDM